MASIVLKVLIWAIIIYAIYQIIAFAFNPNTLWEVSTPLVNLEQSL